MNRSTRTASALLIAAASTLGLSGCGGAAKTFGLDVTPPNAYEVGTEAPLSMPPDLQALPTPEPGAPRPQQVSASRQAEDVLAPQSALASGDTTMGAGQTALLQEAGPAPPAGIRAEVNRQAELESRSPGFISSLMSLGASNGHGETTVDAAAEQKRLQENAALGAPVTQGSTPKEAPQSKGGLLNRLFGWL